MARTIEIVCVGCDRYDDVHNATVHLLSASQGEFLFRIPANSRRQALSYYRRTSFDEGELSDALRDYHKAQSQPGEAYVVGLVDAPLKSNAFGFFIPPFNELPPIAAVSVAGFDRYTKSLDAFLCFFLLKYAVSFLTPDEATAKHEPSSCLFAPYRDRRELTAKMAGASLCDNCKSRFRLRPSEYEAVESLLQVVKQLQRQTRVSTLIMKGGGVKGIAFTGALAVLARPEYRQHYHASTFVGASAGAIAASFLAAGLSVDELGEQLEQNFLQFLDPRRRLPLNFLLRGGLHSGTPIKDWIERTIREKFEDLVVPNVPVKSNVLMAKEPYRRLVIYAADRYGTHPYDSMRHTFSIATAVRFSMSIPFFFTVEYDGAQEMFDGGLLNNYPAEVFQRDNPDDNGEFVGLYLTEGDHPNRQSRFRAFRIMSILLNRDEAQQVERHRGLTAIIDCSPISTVDFDLSESDKQFLNYRGCAAALRLAIREGWDQSGDASRDLAQVEAALQQLEPDISKRYLKIRRRSRIKAVTIGALAIVGAACVLAAMGDLVIASLRNLCSLW